MNPPRPSGMNYAAALGRYERKNWESKFKLYQATQPQLNRTAARISRSTPQRLDPVSLLFIQAVVAPLVPSLSLPPHSTVNNSQGAGRAACAVAAGDDAAACKPAAAEISPNIRSVGSLYAGAQTPGDVAARPSSKPATGGQSAAYDSALIAEGKNITTTTLVQEENDDEPPFTMQCENTRVFELLKEHQFVDGVVDDITLNSLVKAAILFLQKDRSAIGLFARQLQQANGLYGGNAEEGMSDLAQKTIARSWLERNILNTRLPYLVEEFVLVHAAKDPLTTDNLNDFAVDELNNIAEEFADISPWILQYLFFEELPCLRYFYTLSGVKDPDLPLLQHMQLLDFRWGEIHAGLRFAQSLGLNPDEISIQQAFQFGKMLHAQLQEGLVSLSWWKFFALPAMMLYMEDFPDAAKQMSPDERRAIGTQALLHYDAAYKKYQIQHNPILRFNHSMSAYKTRSQLAQAIIDKRCPGADLTSYLNQRSMDCATPASDAHPTLPDINHLYREQVNKVANAYNLLDRLMLIDELGQLAQDDIDLLSNGLVKHVRVDFTAADLLNSHPFVGGNQHARNSLIVDLDKAVEFIEVKSAGHADQLYALKRTAQGYTIARIGRLAQDYYPFLAADKRPMQDSNFLLRINHNTAALKTAQQPLAVLVGQITTKHKQDFFKTLYDHGYDKTTREKLRDFLLSFIPFYTCITSIQDDNVQDAVIACSLDAISLLPLLGQITNLSLRMVNVLGRGATIAGHNIANELAVRSALRSVLMHGGKNFIQYGLLPASEIIGKKELRALSLATLRTIDPGFELVGGLSVMVVRQFIRLGYTVSPKLSHLHQLFPQITRSLEQLPAQANQNGAFRSAFLPGLDKQVQVTRLGGDAFQGQPVYVRVNPDTGEPFGRKYLLTPDATLSPLPIGAARRLRHILEYGLSGRYAPQQGTQWAAQSSQITHVLLRQIELSMRHGHTLEQLAIQHHVPLDRLSRFIAPDGKLTALGNYQLSLAEMRGISVAAIPVRAYNVLELPRQILSNPGVKLALPPAQSPAQLPVAIAADDGVRNNFVIKEGSIMAIDGTYFTYDLDLDVFIKDRREASPFYFLVNKDTQRMQTITPEDALSRAADITMDARTAVIKALGVDLELAQALNHHVNAAMPRTPIEKRISYIWVGNQPLPADVLLNLEENCEIANAYGYSVNVYLSEQSRQFNYDNLAGILCGSASCDVLSQGKNQLKILETTNFYKKFKSSINFPQYQDAIAGNKGTATNYASAVDILRLSVIKEKGGLYMDVDDRLTDVIGQVTLSVEPDGLLLPGLLSSNMPAMDHLFGTSFFGAHPGNTVLDAILQEIHRRYELTEYRNFYHNPRPAKGDKDALIVYANKLSYLTGPDVFNHVVLQRSPKLKQFREVAKLHDLCDRPRSSKIFNELLERAPSQRELTPLANTYLVGNLHSWQYNRKK